MKYQLQAYRLSLVREEGCACEVGEPIFCPADAIKYLKQVLLDADREHFIVVALDARNKPIGYNVTSTGSVSATLIHPREAFKFAILANASSILIVHNHVSGNLEPSPDDLDMAQRLSQAGELIGIEVLDAFIITSTSYISFREQGLLPSQGGRS